MYGWRRDHDESFHAGASATMSAASQQQQQQGQWGQEETRELIRIRADMERDSAASKRSKALWEAVSAAMLGSGFSRTPDQCKCKWKNLLNRYKGKETSDPANGRQCPFFEELHALFTQRAKDMQRLLLESEAGSPRFRKKAKRSNAVQSSEEFSEDEEEGSDEEAPARSKRSKRKSEGAVPEKSSKAGGAASSRTDIRETLEDFFQQQMRMEKQWLEMMERRSHEQLLFEQEWRQSMEKLERERLVAERAWREREEQRRAREESRAERRDALLTTLLNSLIGDHNV